MKELKGSSYAAFVSLSALVAAITAGCAPTLPPLEIQPCYRSPMVEEITSTSPCHYQWWEELQDPLLSQLICGLQDRNIDLLLAREELNKKNDPVERDLFLTKWNNIAAGAATVYVQLRAAQEQLSLLDEAIASMIAIHALTEDLTEAGFTDSIDLERSKAELAQLHSGRAPLSQKIGQLQHALSTAWGIEPNGLTCLLEDKTPLPTPPLCMPVGTPCTLLKTRADLRNAKRALLSPVEVRKNYLTYKKAVFTALTEVEESIASFSSLKVEREYLTVAADAAQRGYEETYDLYERGLKSLIEVQEAHQELYRRKRLVIDNSASLTISYINLYKNLNG